MKFGNEPSSSQLTRLCTRVAVSICRAQLARFLKRRLVYQQPRVQISIGQVYHPANAKPIGVPRRAPCFAAPQLDRTIQQNLSKPALQRCGSPHNFYLRGCSLNDTNIIHVLQVRIHYVRALIISMIVSVFYTQYSQCYIRCFVVRKLSPHITSNH